MKLVSAPFEPPFWLISDTHFFHDNIIRYCGRPEDHDAQMLKNWVDSVKADDIILHLGDITMGKRDAFEKIAPSLTGQKYLIKGNHDTRNDEYYRKLGFTIVLPFQMDYKGYTVGFTHEPIEYGFTTYPKHINVHGHIHERSKESRRFVNASVEQTQYAPVWIESLLDSRIEELEARVEP